MLSSTDHALADRSPEASEQAPLMRLIYTSQASKVPGRMEIDRLMATSRQRNKTAGLSGLLVHHQTHYMQCLEGPPEAVEATFARIRRDPRHFDVTECARSQEEKRAFSHWYMAYATIGEKTWDMLAHVDWHETGAYTFADDRQAGELPRGFALLERVWEMYRHTLDANPGPPD